MPEFVEFVFHMKAMDESNKYFCHELGAT